MTLPFQSKFIALLFVLDQEKTDLQRLNALRVVFEAFLDRLAEMEERIIHLDALHVLENQDMVAIRA